MTKWLRAVCSISRWPPGALRELARERRRSWASTQFIIKTQSKMEIKRSKLGSVETKRGVLSFRTRHVLMGSTWAPHPSVLNHAVIHMSHAFLWSYWTCAWAAFSTSSGEVTPPPWSPPLNAVWISLLPSRLEPAPTPEPAPVYFRALEALLADLHSWPTAILEYRMLDPLFPVPLSHTSAEQATVGLKVPSWWRAA